MLDGFRALRSTVAALLGATLLGACATTAPLPGAKRPIDDQGRLPAPNVELDIPQLGPCYDSEDTTLALDADEPVTVLVHGCYASAGRFRALAQVYALHGQQTACFTYNDRDSLTASADQLATALDRLQDVMRNDRVDILAHSQGGLIARRTLSEEHNELWRDTPLRLRLMTVSAPFAGIEAASHCGSRTARYLSLGITALICQIVTGDKWPEIPGGSDFIETPGTLKPQVREHIKVVTDERNTCRRRDDSGQCLESDYVFSLREQQHRPVDDAPRVENVRVEAGHVEIVGNAQQPPVKLIRILQRRGLLTETRPEMRAELRRLFATLYGSADRGKP